MDGPPSGTSGLRAFIRTLRRRKWTIVVVVVVFVGASVVYDVLKKPEYTATAQVQLTPQISTALLEANNSSLLNSATPVDVPTQIQVIQSNDIAQRVKAKIHAAPPVKVTQIGLTDVVSLSVTSTNARLAARAANLYAKTYIASEQLAAVVALSSASQTIQQHITSLQSQINAVNAQLVHVPASSPLQSTYLSELSSLEQSQSTLRSQLSTYQTAGALTTGGGQVVSAATVPSKPSAPKPLEYGLIALFLGLVVGIALAGVQEALDEKLRSVDDLENVTGDVPIIGLVPPVGAWKDRERPYLVSAEAPKSPPAEAYRSLRTSVQFLALDREHHSVLFTSPRSAEGKTTTVANVALTMAAAGQRVIALDCDLRRPRIHSFFKVPNNVGFTSVLLGQCDVEEALQHVPDTNNLRVMAAGLVPPNPSELLSTRRAEELFEHVRHDCDVLLIDSPPILPVTDAVVLAPRVDSVVLVTSAGATTRRDLRRAVETLHRVDAHLAGVVWNKALEEDAYADYRYAYPYSAGSEELVAAGMGSNGGAHRPAHAGRRILRRSGSAANG